MPGRWDPSQFPKTAAMLEGSVAPIKCRPPNCTLRVSPTQPPTRPDKASTSWRRAKGRSRPPVRAVGLEPTLGEPTRS